MTEMIQMSDGPIDAEESFSLTVIRNNDSIALGRKTRGYGAGQLVLPGGKDHFYLSDAGIGLLPGGDNALREVHEETGMTIERPSIRQVGMLYISTEDDTKDVQIFSAATKETELVPSDELESLAWYSEESLPYDEMPQDYRLWLPSVLGGYIVSAFVETQQDNIIEAKIFRQQINPLGRMELI